MALGVIVDEWGFVDSEIRTNGQDARQGLNYLQAIVIGILQGVTELFPVSSLGHSVLVPALLGGSWAQLATQSSTSHSEASPYLAFIVALHVATALALLFVFRETWIRVIMGFFRSVRRRRIETSAERLAWLIVIGTVPVGITGLILEHTFRTLFAKPEAAAIFLTINGVILAAGELLRRRSETTAKKHPPAQNVATSHSDLGLNAHSDLDKVAVPNVVVIGLFQTLALLAGISRSGITMVGGLVSGLDHEDAAQFSFLLATPVIFAAGFLKLPSLAGSAGDHIRGQVLVGAIVAAISAYVSTRFLLRFFQSRTLTPFAVYSLSMGLFCVIHFA
jgi:undecaprenyl-diphosphatase